MLTVLYLPFQILSTEPGRLIIASGVITDISNSHVSVSALIHFFFLISENFQLESLLKLHVHFVPLPKPLGIFFKTFKDSRKQSATRSSSANLAD